MNDSFAVFDRYRISCVLLNTNSDLIYLLRHSPGWEVQHEDAVAALMVRGVVDEKSQALKH
jgi:hypothetical protein